MSIKEEVLKEVKVKGIYSQLVIDDIEKAIDLTEELTRKDERAKAEKEFIEKCRNCADEDTDKIFNDLRKEGYNKAKQETLRKIEEKSIITEVCHVLGYWISRKELKKLEDSDNSKIRKN